MTFTEPTFIPRLIFNVTGTLSISTKKPEYPK